MLAKIMLSVDGHLCKLKSILVILLPVHGKQISIRHFLFECGFCIMHKHPRDRINQTQAEDLLQLIKCTLMWCINK